MPNKISVDNIKLTCEQKILKNQFEQALKKYKNAFDRVSTFCSQGWTYHTHPGAMNSVYQASYWIRQGSSPDKRPPWMETIMIEAGKALINQQNLGQLLQDKGVSIYAVSEWSRRILDRDIEDSKEIMIPN